MAKPTLEEIKAAADEYVKLGRKIGSVELKREAAMEPLVQRHAEEMREATASFDRTIERLETNQSNLRAKVLEFLSGKSRTYQAEGEVAEFGVVVGSKPGTRVVDREKLRKLCKAKGVDYDAVTTVLLGEADKALGASSVDEISERPETPTRNEYLRPKQ